MNRRGIGSAFAVAVVAALAQVGGPGCQSPFPPAPDLQLPGMDGVVFDVRDHRGEVILLNFWATWCAPCVVEMPELERLHRDYRERGLTVVGISIDSDGFETVRPFLTDRDISYKIVHDSGPAQAAFGGLHGVPTTVLIDRKGAIRQIIIGVFDAALLEASVRSLIGRPSSG